MSERMIEECAKAICTTMDLEAKEPCARICTGCKIAARAVLTRLRDPTPGMVEAGLVHIQGLSLTYLGNALELAFTAMIDAALEGK